VVVANIMAGAGLTHGGFYVHFDSKDELLAHAIEAAFAETDARFGQLTEGRAPASALTAYIDAYLSQQHREQPDRGCPAASLVGDLPRLTGDSQVAFQSGVERMKGRLAGWLQELGRADADELAASALSEMVGALALARANPDERAAAAFLRQTRTRLKDRLGLTSR